MKKEREQKKKMKKIIDYPEYSKPLTLLTDCRNELPRLSTRRDALCEELSRLSRGTGTEDAWQTVKESGGVDVAAYSVGTRRDEIKEEIKGIDNRIAFLTEAIERGEHELSTIRGKLSLEPCAAVRPNRLKRAERVLNAIKEICKANMEDELERDQLEQAGFETGSLVSVAFDTNGFWNDPFGGKVVAHCKRIAENFPELKKLAMSELEE